MTTLFFENFFKILGLPFQTISSGQPSVSVWGVTTFYSAATTFTEVMNNFVGDEGSSLSGTSSMVSATATVLTYLQTYCPEYADINLTQAYIDSLSESELNELILTLDEKGNELELTEDEAVLKRYKQ